MSGFSILWLWEDGNWNLFRAPRSDCALSLRRLRRQVPHTDQVVGSPRKGEDPSHLEDSTIPNLSQQGDRLQPSKALFNALPLPLTDGISGALRGASINRTPTRPFQVLGHVRRDL